MRQHLYGLHTEHLERLRNEAKVMATLRSSCRSWRTRAVQLLLAMAQRLEPTELEVVVQGSRAD